MDVYIVMLRNKSGNGAVITDLCEDLTSATLMAEFRVSKQAGHDYQVLGMNIISANKVLSIVNGRSTGARTD
ncbi:hypothetical protein UFOVP150_46 [uncultured Caudovirales phage]|uniref:Uncharacterized protein n=1 Tax=uncultured Caudovirales phage TaxID=2100421 RepID=A0A6J7WA79_9CAUD|nr:hypothetical protein UFOVP150_46 [uncultured Caudovirales phage]